MKITRNKRILGLFILTFVVLFSGVIQVYAADIACDKISDTYFTDKYGLDINWVSNGVYEITTSPAKEADQKAAKFIIEEIKTYKGNADSATGGKELRKFVDDNVGHVITKKEDVEKVVNNLTLTYNKSMILTRTNGLDDGNAGIYIKLRPAEGFEDADAKRCKKKDLWMEVAMDVADDEGTAELTNLPEITTTCSSSLQKINCDGYKDKYKDTDSTEYKFCYAKEMAEKDKENNVTYNGKKTKVYFGTIDSEKTYLAYENKFKDSPYIFQCDYNKLFDSQTAEVLKDDSKYYVKENKKYLFGSGKYKLKGGTYVYNYEAYEPKGKKEAATCTISCDEAVTVEYGAPVLSTAGMCFEYKVKVTSIVTCGLSEITTPDDSDNSDDTTVTTTTCESIPKPSKPKVCHPRPQCKHKGGGTYDQGGPSEDFDACIKECDKGKYTDKCVTKCYKAIYGSSTKLRRSTSSSDLALYDVLKVDNDVYKSTSGYMSAPRYKYDSNGKLMWDTGQTGDNKYVRNITAEACANGNPGHLYTTDSTWHNTHSWGSTACTGYNMYTANGIPKTSTCTDSCSWIGCTKDTSGNNDFYLNETQATQDWEENKKVYEDLLEKCASAVGCTTTTSEYQISADVKAEEKTITFNFPYSEGQDGKEIIKNGKSKDNWDKIQSRKDDSDVTDDYTTNKRFTTVLHRNYCYATSTAKNKYQTEWSFPGTWYENKQQFMTYTRPTDNTGYTEFERQFCIPDYAVNVNAKWGEYYFATVHKNDKTYSIDDTTYLNGIKCKTGDTTNYSSKASYIRNTKYGKDGVEPEEWNIHAKTKRFGYFGWYINMDCFYAVMKPEDKSNDNNVPTSTSSTYTYCEKDTKTPYVVRSVDLKNLFPNKNGSKLTDPAHELGRSQGFNWSEHANQTKAGEASDNTRYYSMPQQYAKWVQEKGYSVYDDNYLDYYIVLSKENITAIRKEIKDGHKLDSFDSNSKDVVDSVVNYQSDLIRNSGNIKEAHYPVGDAIRCNNMKNYKSTECDHSWEVK